MGIKYSLNGVQKEGTLEQLAQDVQEFVNRIVAKNQNLVLAAQKEFASLSEQLAAKDKEIQHLKRGSSIQNTEPAILPFKKQYDQCEDSPIEDLEEDFSDTPLDGFQDEGEAEEVEETPEYRYLTVQATHEYEDENGNPVVDTVSAEVEFDPLDEEVRTLQVSVPGGVVWAKWNF